MPDPSGSRPDRNLAMELVRVTEYGALAAARWVGLGEKDEAPMLYNGEQIGDGSPPQVDIAVDPLEGTTLAAEGTPRALAVMAMSERGTMFDPGPCVYMMKMAAQRAYRDVLDLDRPLPDTLKQVAQVKGTDVGDVTVMMLKRDRHKDAVAEIRKAGARIRFIDHGDVSAALLAIQDESPVDLLWGIGGTPEGVISAASTKCIGGVLIGRLWPRNDEERQAALDAGYDLDEVLDQDRLVAGDDVFFAATGVTDGDVLDGVHYTRDGATTESLVMRSRSGTVRRVSAVHDRAKLREISGERAG